MLVRKNFRKFLYKSPFILYYKEVGNWRQKWTRLGKGLQ